MSIVRSLDGRATAGLMYFCGIAHLPRLLDLRYLRTEKNYENAIDHHDVERVPQSKWPGHVALTSEHPPIISRRVRVHSLTGPLPLY